MREYITKAKVIEAIEKAIAPEITTIGDYETIGVFTRESIERIVSNLPAADVAEVVRCRDCKWFNQYTMECESDDVATDHEGGASFSLNFGPNDFCSYGRRKEAAHE